MVIQAVLQVVGPMLLELVIREVAVPTAKRIVRGTQSATSDATAPSPLPDATYARLQALSAVQVVSALPGRARFEVAGLRGQPELARGVADDLTPLAGIERVEASPKTGRVLVHFDSAAQSVATLAIALERARASRLIRSGPGSRQLAAVV